MMKNGKMTMMQDGKEVNGIDRETTLSDGTTGHDERQDDDEEREGSARLREGQTVMLDGKMMEGGKSMASDKDMKMDQMGS